MYQRQQNGSNCIFGSGCGGKNNDIVQIRQISWDHWHISHYGVQRWADYAPKFVHDVLGLWWPYDCQVQLAQYFYNVKNGSSIITSKSLSNISVMKTNNVVFVVYKTKHQLKCQFSGNTSPLLRFFWRNIWRSVFDVVKILRYYVSSDYFYFELHKLFRAWFFHQFWIPIFEHIRKGRNCFLLFLLLIAYYSGFDQRLKK